MSFDAIGIAGTGLSAHRKWLDAISDNIANGTLAPQGLSIDECKAMGAQATAVCKAATADSLKMSLALCSTAGLLSFGLFMLARRTVAIAEAINNARG